MGSYFWLKLHHEMLDDLKLGRKIDNSIGSASEDLDLWREVKTKWIGRGFNPLNVLGMLNIFDNGGRFKDIHHHPQGSGTGDDIAFKEEDGGPSW
jgi:hypothetical protein